MYNASILKRNELVENSPVMCFKEEILCLMKPRKHFHKCQHHKYFQIKYMTFLRRMTPNSTINTKVMSTHKSQFDSMHLVGDWRERLIQLNSQCEKCQAHVLPEC